MHLFAKQPHQTPCWATETHFTIFTDPRVLSKYFTNMFSKGDKFCDFQLTSMARVTKTFPNKGSTLNGKNLLLEENIIKGDKN